MRSSSGPHIGNYAECPHKSSFGGRAAATRFATISTETSLYAPCNLVPNGAWTAGPAVCRLVSPLCVLLVPHRSMLPQVNRCRTCSSVAVGVLERLCRGTASNDDTHECKLEMYKPTYRR